MGKGAGKGGVEPTTLQSMRIFVIFVNVVTAIAGLCLLALGIYTFTQSDLVLNSKAIPVTQIVAGMFMFAVSLLGCFGASSESRNMLIVYFVVLVLLILTQIVVVILTFTNTDKIDAALDNAWQNAYDHHPRVIRDIENEYFCCGFRNVTDRAIPKKHPDSCVNSPNFGYEDACYDQLVSGYKANRAWIVVVASGIILVQMLALVFTYNLLRRIPSEREREALYREEHERLVSAGRVRQSDITSEYGSMARGGSGTDPETLP